MLHRSGINSLTPIAGMSLTVEATHILVNTLQTATGELNIQVRMLGGSSLLSKLSSDTHAGAEGTSGFGYPKREG